MIYNIDTTPFYDLQNRVLELPEEIPESTQYLESVLFSYLRATKCQFDLMMALMKAFIEVNEDRRYTRHFLEIFDKAAQKSLSLLEDDVRYLLNNNLKDAADLTYAMRDSEIPSEFVMQDISFAESIATVDVKSHLDTATTVTNSLKKFIEKHSKKKFVGTVLHTINEVIGIVRGVVV